MLYTQNEQKTNSSIFSIVSCLLGGGGGGRVKHILCLVSVMGLVTYKIPLSKKSSR